MAKLKFENEDDTFDIGLENTSSAVQATYETGTVVEIPIDLIDIGENIRDLENDDESKLRQLGDSILTDGQIEPCIVYQNGDRYVIKAGSRRYKACMLMDVPKLKCIIDKKFENEKERIIYQATENEHRDNMNPREREQYMARLLELGMNQNEIANALHKNKGWVSEALSAYTTLEENSDLKDIIDESISTRDIWKIGKMEKDEFSKLKETLKEKKGDKKLIKEEIKKNLQNKKEKASEEIEKDKEENEKINKDFGLDFEIDNSADDAEEYNNTESELIDDTALEDNTDEYTVSATFTFTINENNKRVKYVGNNAETDIEKFIINQAKNYYMSKGYTVD